MAGFTLETGTDDLGIEYAGRGDCEACGHPDRTLARFTMPPLVEGGLDINLCGVCVAKGLAIVLGQSHVLHGGDVADLRMPQRPG